MRSPYCNYDPETTVAAHSNLGEHGKGMGQKADDFLVAFCCSACHDWYDGRNATRSLLRQPLFDRAMHRTWRLLLDLGVLK